MASRFYVTKEKLAKVEDKYSHLSKRTKAHTVYTDRKGKMVLSVTTILKLLPKFALIPWAYNLGLVRQDYNKVRQEAADIGTVVHDLINSREDAGVNNYLNDMDYHIGDRARWSFENYKKFKKDHDLKILKQELTLTFGGDRNTPAFGGTCDMVAEVDGKLSLVDFKTGNAVYKESVLQLAAYDMLLGLEGIKVEQYCLVRVPSKEPDTYEITIYQPQDNYKTTFILLAKACYALEESIGLSLHAKGSS